MAAESSTPAFPTNSAALAPFRQQAGAILAQERGLTPACRVKLAGLARQLGIPDGQIDAAILSLSESPPATAPENPQVEKFRNRLRKDLAGKSRAIIGPTIEAQIAGTAVAKYGLTDAIARQVVGEVAAELGLRRISADEAVRNLAAQIDQAAGDQGWLAKEAWDRLRVAGGKWGIELEVIDQLIDEKLAANRAQKHRQRFLTKAIAFGAGGTFAAMGVAMLLVAFFLPGRPPEVVDPATTGSLATSGTTAAPAAAKSPPKWWDVDLSIAVATSQTKFPAFAPIYDFLIADAPADRTIGYRKLAELAANPNPPANLRPALAEIFSGCYALEPDDAAAGELLAGLLALVPAVDAPLPKVRGQYDVAYWAGETAVRCYHRAGLTEARGSTLNAALQRTLRVSLAALADRPAREKEAKNGVTERLFDQLTHAAADSPAGVAVLFGYLTDLSADLADEQFERLEASFLAAALPAAGKDWKAYQEAIARAVASPDPLNALKLLDAYQRATDPDLKQQLAELLVVRSAARPKSWEPIDVVSAVRKGLGISGSAAALSERDRWQLLKLRADAALARPLPVKTDSAAWLAQSVELAHLTTLAIALAQGDSGHAVFDAQIEAPPQLASGGGSSGPDAAAPALPPPRRTFAPLAARDQQEIERLVNLVASFARHQPVQRASAIRGLALAAERAADISPQQAARVTAYLLSEKLDDEHNVVLQALVNLRRWKHLRLAVADYWPRSRLTDEQRRQLAGALLRGEISDAEATSPNLPGRIVQSVLAELEDEAAGPGPVAALNSPGQVFDAAAELLAETYRTRGRLLSAPSVEVAAADSPAKAIYLAIGPLSASLRPIAAADDKSYLARLPHEANAWGFITRDDLRRTVAINHVFVQLSARCAARMRPTQAALAEKIAAELIASDASAPTVLAQLHSHEAAALRIWMLYATQS